MSDSVITLGGFNRRAWAGWVVGLGVAAGGGYVLYRLMRRKGEAPIPVVTPPATGTAPPAPEVRWVVSSPLAIELVEPITAEIAAANQPPLALDQLDPKARTAFLAHYGSLGNGINIYDHHGAYFIADFGKLEYRILEVQTVVPFSVV